MEGFSEGMEGHKLNETFDISLTLPENYPAEIAGKDAVFTVTINSITEEILPELNDEFVQKISDKAKTVDEYKKQVKKDLETSNKKDGRVSEQKQCMDRSSQKHRAEKRI